MVMTNQLISHLISITKESKHFLTTHDNTNHFQPRESNSKKELKHCQAIPCATSRIKRTFIHTFQQKFDTEKSRIISATVKQEAQHFKKITWSHF